LRHEPPTRGGGRCTDPAGARPRVEEEDGTIVERKLKGEDRLEITLHEVVSDVDYTMDEDAARLIKDGVAGELQELLAALPERCGEGLRLVRREWPTHIGPVDLVCRDPDDGWVAVEIKRVGTIDAVGSSRATWSGSAWTRRWRAAAACWRPRPSSRRRRAGRSARVRWVEIDLPQLRGEREPALTLFGA
jgi:Holliday junction resolvase-like predicted endonuclease